MRIDPSLPQTNVAQPEATQSAAEQLRPDSTAASLSTAGIHTPSDELTQLLNQIGRVPEVRPDLLKEVAQRLAAGEYRTPKARDAVVEAILGSQPG